MTPSQTPFLGLERLAGGDPFSSDGWRFQFINPVLLDRAARLGVRDHRHDAHAAMADPSSAPTVAAVASGGSIPADTPVYVTYTLNDADGGETLGVTPEVVTMPAGFTTPDSPPAAAVSHAAGALLAASYSYAVTVGDGAGGETAIGPAVTAIVDPGFANSEVALTGLAAILATASGGAVGASWRLWRSQGGSPWYLIGTGTGAAFTDNGVIGDCTVQPPAVGTTVGANSLEVTVPGGQPVEAVTYNIYADFDGTFISPCLLATHPIADAGTVHTFTALNALDGAPPIVSTCYGGANQIDPDTDILNWTWKRPVADAAALPVLGNTDGDGRVTLDDHHLHIWNDGGAIWIDVTSDPDLLTENLQAAAYVLVITDAGKAVTMNSGAGVALTVPPHSAVAFAVGTVIKVLQYGAGQVTVTAGAGVTLRTPGAGLVKTAAQFAMIELWQRAADEWVLSGNLAA